MRPSLNQHIGLKMRKLRFEKGWTQIQAARMLNISRSAYSRMERGETATWTTLTKSVKAVYAISLEELVSGYNENNT